MNSTVNSYTTYVIKKDGKYLCGCGFDWTDDLTHPELYTNKNKEDVTHFIEEYWDKWDSKENKNIPGKLQNAKVFEIYIVTTTTVYQVL